MRGYMHSSYAGDVDARDYAVLTLDQKQLPGFPRQTFKRRSPVPPTDPRDRALGENLVAGVVKNLKLLDTLIAAYAKRPVTQVDNRARLILLVAIAQFRLLDRVPDHALVTEAVHQTRRLGEPGLAKAAGFVNAVMREAIRNPDVGEKLPTRANTAGYCEVVLSHPRPLVEKLMSLFSPADTIRFCEHNNRTPPTLARLIGDATIESLSAGDLKITPHQQPQIVVVEGAKAADFARWAAEGIAQVQDATSAGMVAQLDVQRGMTVLDRCCGVGTKTQQLSELVGESGKVFAVDAAGARISLLRKLSKQRASMANVALKRGEWAAEFPDDWPAAYDRILIDAPCSNSGVLARRPEARYAQTAAATAELVELQLKLLADTWPLVAPGGLLAYATCSVWPEENSGVGGVVKAFITRTPGVELADERAWLPSFGTADPTQYRDGGYVAILRKRDS